MKFTKRTYRKALRRIDERFWATEEPGRFFDLYEQKEALKRRVKFRAVREGKAW